MRKDIRLVAIDLDDTLLRDDLTIAPGAKEAIRKAQQKGVTVVLATGRMFPAALPFAQELGLTGPLITYNGALIRTAAGETWWHRPVPRELALEILDFGAAAGWTVQCYCDDRLYVRQINDDVKYYLEIARVPVQECPDMRALLSERLSTKLLSIGSPEEIVRRAESLRQAFAGRLTITISKPRFVEMLAAGVSKAAALAEVARRLHVPREQVMAIGDSFNDLDMIQWAGVGVAMGNAPDAVKELADCVVGTNMEEGVAEAFERFVFA